MDSYHLSRRWKPNYAFKRTAELALGSNQVFAPQPLNAALAFITSTSHMRKILLAFVCLVLLGCSGDLPTVDLREGNISVHGGETNRVLTKNELADLGAWLKRNGDNWSREYFSLPPYPSVAVLGLNFTSGQYCALHIYSNNVIFTFLGSEGSQWKREVPVGEIALLNAIVGIKSES